MELYKDRLRFHISKNNIDGDIERMPMFMRKKDTASIITVWISAIALTACVATGGKFVREAPANESEALVYIYRPAEFVGSAQRPNVKLDGVFLGSLVSGGYLAKRVPLGVHTLLLTGEVNPFIWNYSDRREEFTIERSGNYYFRYTPTSRSGQLSLSVTTISHSYKFQQVSEDVALNEIGELNRVE